MDNILRAIDESRNRLREEIINNQHRMNQAFVDIMEDISQRLYNLQNNENPEQHMGVSEAVQAEEAEDSGDNIETISEVEDSDLQTEVMEEGDNEDIIINLNIVSVATGFVVGYIVRGIISTS